MRKINYTTRFFLGILTFFLWGACRWLLPCSAASPVLHISYPRADAPVLRAIPYYPSYHGVYAHRRHFLCGRELASAEEMRRYMVDYIPLVETIGDVEERYVDRCEEMLSLLPESICYLFVDYGWHFYVTTEDIAMTEFNGEYSSVKGVTDVQSLYIKVANWDNATSTTILHEFGHFLDYCCNFPSEKNGFRTVLELETEAARDMGMKYGLGDNEEYFAESFLWYLTAPEELQACTPLTYDFIHRCMTEIIYKVHE